jgi:hypothetical protein
MFLQEAVIRQDILSSASHPTYSVSLVPSLMAETIKSPRISLYRAGPAYFRAGH